MRSPPFWPFLDGVSLHRRVLAHPQHCFPFWGLSANVFSLTGYDLILSDIFQRANTEVNKTPFTLFAVNLDV